MSNLNLELVQKITADTQSAYAALERASKFSRESSQVMLAADQLLKQCALGFVSPSPFDGHASPNVEAARTNIANAFAELQQTYAQLKEALYQLMHAQVNAQAWRESLITARALQNIQSSYRDVDAFVEKIPVLETASAELRAEKYDETVSRLEQYARAHPADTLVGEALTHAQKRRAEHLERLEQEKKRKAEEERKRKEEAECKRKEALLEIVRRIEFIRIPAGEFTYGDDNKLQRTEEYEIGKTPVTNAQFNAFVELTNYKWNYRDNDPEHAQHPVVTVSWNDAVAFCQWASTILNKDVRLPTEQEWEKAARGTDGRKYPWGNEAPDVTRCNFNKHVGTTTPVGKYSPRGDSPYGCVDMAGNVWEWTSSAHEREGYSVRGGAWNYEAANVQAAFRFGYSADLRNLDLGYRVSANLRKG